MKPQIVSTERAPAAVGPYSQAVIAGQTVYVSGQLGIDPATAQLVGPDTAVQARQALANIKAILEAAGSSLDQVVKATVYLADINDFAAVNEIYAASFPGPDYPARAAFQVAALPLAARIEIEAIALVD